ncbi:Retrovirus-related Pol polyprotein from transposon 412-like Protein [Tribolium castaneum]|uniref:Retrovirus-related Pol polyprotein from transposon 412-like Protein n=1 Tax=Tribolium castaneum TaxID=7070 RepID=D7EK81_TRICA|nr:Retrovirus-related Pol polyprotein from transposon 412-like Protein [Tribolium castaneum]
MTQAIQKYCKECYSCNIRKIHPQNPSELQTMQVPSRIFELASMDIVGPLNLTSSGHKYILMCMDFLTRYPECVALSDIRAETLREAFVNNVILCHRAPRFLLTDCGAQFVSELFEEICKRFNIEKIQTSPYRPITNEVIERMHHVLETMLSHYVSDENDVWDEMLPFVMMAYRNRIHEASKESPFFLMYGRDVELPFLSIIKPDRFRFNVDEYYHKKIIARFRKAL